ncbi:hypothetical protein [Nocardioides jejuensis]|uniref:DUF11 domain-containing protein n=1 Tax=Nocardioides jejuensis TaxID=2502782 RepID=A0A4R1CH79_9ACTN|nr:hypothetical protein [Nocardioides jejuensis]TCJ30754.1 hypothetical protein EPD65_01585 [Nocardioides jejuensis]
MLKSFRRRTSAALLAVVSTVALVGLSAAPANAASSARLLMKGVGSVYSDAPYNNVAVVPGGPAKPFGFKLVNNSGAVQQYKVETAPAAGATAKLYKGTTLLPNTWTSAPVNPGASILLTLKVSLPGSAPQTQFYNQVSVRDAATDEFLAYKYAVANTAAPATQTTAHTALLKTGSQANVGGATSYMYESSNALKVGQNVNFTLRLANNSQQISAINLTADGVYCGVVATYKVGTTNVTALVQGSGYSTGNLLPGKYKNVTVNLKRVGADTCDAYYQGLHAVGVDGDTYVFAHLPFAAL